MEYGGLPETEWRMGAITGWVDKGKVLEQHDDRHTQWAINTQPKKTKLDLDHARVRGDN
jgi:hypothetical protein